MKFSADRATVTLSGRNLWMWTKYTFDAEGLYDPEVKFYSLAASAVRTTHRFP